MAGRKDPIKELAVFLAGNAWSYDRLEVAVRAVCEAKKRPGNPSLAVTTYEVERGRAAFEAQERVIVRVKRRKRKRPITGRLF